MRRLLPLFVLIAALAWNCGALAQTTRDQLPISIEPMVAHVGPIESITFVPGTKLAATGGRDFLVKIWDLDSNQLVKTLSGHRLSVDRLVAFRDGRRLLSSSAREVILWDALAGVQLQKWETNGRRAGPCLAVSTDEQWIVTGGLNFHLAILDPAKAEPRILPEMNCFNAVFEPGSARALLVQGDGTTEYVDARTGARRPSRHSLGIYAPFKSDLEGRRVAVATDDQLGILVAPFPATPPRWLRPPSPSRGSLAAVALPADGSVVALYDDGSLHRWRRDGTPHGAPTMLPLTANASVRAAAISDDGQRVLYADSPRGGRGNHVDEPTSSLRLWNATAARIVWEKAPPTIVELTALVYSGDGKRLASLASDGTVRVRDAATGAVLVNFPKTACKVVSLAMSHANERLVTGDDCDVVTVWNAAAGAPLRQIKSPTGAARFVAISPDGRRVALNHLLWDLDTNEKTRLEHGEYARTAAFDAAGSSLAIGTTLFDVRSRRPIAQNLPDASVYTFVAGGDDVMACCDFRSALRWSRLEGELAGEKRISVDAWGEDRVYAAFSPDGRYMASVAWTGSLEIQDLTKEHSKILRTVAFPTAIALPPGGRHVAVASVDGVLRLIRVDTGTTVHWLADGDRWLAFTQRGYFDGSRRSGGMVAAVQGFERFSVDQLAPVYNRPDELLRTMGLGSTAQLEHYEAIHRLRLQSLGLKASSLTTNFSDAPEVRLACRRESDSVVRLSVTMAAKPGHPLGRYAVYVNGTSEQVESDGIIGLPPAHVERDVTLSPGNNHIEVSAFEVGGAESLRAACDNDFERKDGAQGNLYYLGIGVTAYRDKRLATLSYPARDVGDLGKLFSRMPWTSGRVVASTLVDASVTRKNVLDRLARLVADMKAEDAIVVYLSGHGEYTKDALARYLFLTADFDQARPLETSVAWEDLDIALSRLPARRRVVWLDTCQSGLRDGSRSYVTDRNHYIYNDLLRSSGAVVLSAATGQESSLEIATGTNSPFALALKDALYRTPDRKPRVSRAELAELVARKVRSLTADAQHPVVDRDNPYLELDLPRVDRPPEEGRGPPGVDPRGHRGCGCEVGAREPERGAPIAVGVAAIVLVLASGRRRARANESGTQFRLRTVLCAASSSLRSALVFLPRLTLNWPSVVSSAVSRTQPWDT